MCAGNDAVSHHLRYLFSSSSVERRSTFSVGRWIYWDSGRSKMLHVPAITETKVNYSTYKTPRILVPPMMIVRHRLVRPCYESLSARLRDSCCDVLSSRSKAMRSMNSIAVLLWRCHSRARCEVSPSVEVHRIGVHTGSKSHLVSTHVLQALCNR